MTDRLRTAASPSGPLLLTHGQAWDIPGADDEDPQPTEQRSTADPAGWLQVRWADGIEGVDHGVVREVRRQAAEELAARLRAAPVSDPGARRELGRSVIAKILAARTEQSLRSGGSGVSLTQELALGEAVLAALFGLGRLQPWVDDPNVENIELNGCDQVWISYADGRCVRAPAVAESDTELIELLAGLASRTGAAERSFTTAHPRLHLRLDDGSRLAAVAWTTPRPQVVIRRHRVVDVDLADLIDYGTVDAALAGFLAAAVRAGKNIIVTGVQNSGKTTLVRALCNEFAPSERFATVEQEYELHLHELPDRHPRVVAMQAREGSSERDTGGRPAGQVDLADMVLDALRLNLRRIVVGECRGPEVLAMLQAMSTGDGSMCTVHARSAHHAMDRIVTMCLSGGAGMTEGFAYRLAAGAVDLVVHLHLRDDTGTGGARHRFVSEVLEVEGIGEGSRPAMTTVFAPGPDGRARPAHTPRCLGELTRAGLDPTLLDQPAGFWARPLPESGVSVR